MPQPMKYLDIVPGEGDRSQWTAIITGVINLAMMVASLFGVTLPFEVWAGVNTVAGTLFAVFFADKVNRNTDATLAVAAKQPNEVPVVIVEPGTKVSGSGVDILPVNKV
jgi:uncharacterized membrane protein